MILPHLLARRFRAPAGEVDPSADRGDDFTPTSDAEDAEAREAAAALAETARLAEEAKKDTAKGTGDEKEPKKGEKTDSDDEETEEEKAEREAEEAKAAEEAKKSASKRIPLARHKEILDRERAERVKLENEVAALKKGQAVVATNEEIAKIEDRITGYEKEYNKQLADGDLDKAAETMAKIRKASEQISDAKTDMRVAVAEARAYERVRYDNIVERLELAYPALLEGNEEHDPAKVRLVLRLKASYQSEGMAPADALQAAAKDILGAETKKQERAVDTDVKVNAGDLAKAKAEERLKEAVKRNLEVAGKQPPSTTKVGLDSDKAGGSLTARDAVKLSQAEFNKLDQATLARMRGDVVA